MTRCSKSFAYLDFQIDANLCQCFALAIYRCGCGSQPKQFKGNNFSVCVCKIAIMDLFMYIIYIRGSLKYKTFCLWKRFFNFRKLKFYLKVWNIVRAIWFLSKAKKRYTTYVHRKCFKPLFSKLLIEID